MKQKTKRGFTLIEVLIVVSIIGLLTSATLLGLGTFRAAGKDARRMSDLRQIQNALELYYAQKSEYPTGDIYTQDLFKDVGIKSIPLDPDGKTKYGYSSNVCSGVSYVLQAKLEDIKNKALKDDVDGTECGVDCEDPNYCITF